MKYIRYAYYAWLAFWSVILTYPLVYIIGIFLPMFSTMKMGWSSNHSVQSVEPRLWWIFNWYQTPDNSLWGDDTFKAINGISYWSMVKWIWRNPLQGYQVKYIDGSTPATVTGNNLIRDGVHGIAGSFLVEAGGLFQKTTITDNGDGTCTYSCYGWNLHALTDPNVNPKPNPYQATFEFTPGRKSEFTL